MARSELLLRFATGLILVPTAVLSVVLGGFFLFLILELVIIGCALEFWRMVDPWKESLSRSIGIAGALSIGLGFYVGSPLFLIVLSVLFTLGLAVARRSERGPQMTGITTMGVLYPAVFLAHIIPLREMGSGYALTPLVYTWAFDISAYLIGKRFGRRKIVPGISPGKSLEGTLGGFLTVVLVGLVARVTFAGFLSIAHAVGLAVVLCFSGQVGDFFESSLKRSAELKDSSGFFPGHGGMLDRLDSLIFTIPVAYYYFLWLVK